MKFNPQVFERLLFPLHKQVYRQIQETLDTIEEKHPDKLAEILANFEVSAKNDTQTKTKRQGRADSVNYPVLDISILFMSKDEIKISMLHKETAYKISFSYDEVKPSQYKGSHLIIGFNQDKVLHSFIVPIEYLLGFNEKAVLREGSYQIYTHTILPSGIQAEINHLIQTIVDTQALQQFHQNNNFIYIGKTKRTWQERYRQHCRDMGRGSNLLFHRALRREFCDIGVIEHIVERAGLTEKQANEIEEKEIEKRSLNFLFPNGLNMIPGGNAGLKFAHNFAKRTGYAITGEVTSENLESVLVDIQQASLKKHFNTSVMERVKSLLSRLWAENIYFRVNAITGAKNRFSFRQIQAARIYQSSGWSKEKILEYLQKMDSKKIGIDQLERLLKGETYASIPDVLV